MPAEHPSPMSPHLLEILLSNSLFVFNLLCFTIFSSQNSISTDVTSMKTNNVKSFMGGE